MELYIHVEYVKADRDIAYTLQAMTSFQDKANGNYSFDHDTGGHLTLPHPAYSFSLYRLARVPITSADEDGDTAQVEQLVGTSKWTSDTTLEIVDIDDHTQATIQVARFDGRLPTDMMNKEEEDPSYRKWIAQSRQVYKKELDFKPEQYYVYVDMPPIGRLPMLAFALLATRSRPDYDPEPLLWRLCQMASMHITKEGEGVSQSYCYYQSREVIGEMCTIMLRAMLYLQDTERSSSSSDRSTDQWCQLLRFPHLGSTAYDCEDGSELVLELLHLLKTSTFTHPALRDVQKCVRSYVSFLALGTLRNPENDEECIPHAFVILLERKQANALLLQDDGDFLDARDSCLDNALVIESTNYTQSMWDCDLTRYPPNPLKTWIDQKTKKKNSDKWSLLIKTKTSVQEAKEQKMYRSLIALISTDVLVDGEESVGHWVMKDRKTGKVGVELDDVVTYRKGKVKAHTLLYLNKEETSKLSRVLDEKLPHPPLPPVSDKPLQFPVEGERIVGDMRTMDYEECGKNTKLPKHLGVIHNEITSNGLRLTSFTVSM
jgi:hypothetical protein